MTNTLVFGCIGQSNCVGNPPDGVTNTYTSLTDVWMLGEDGYVRPFSEPLFDGTRYATAPINHTSPDTPGQSSFGAMAERLRALGITERLIFVPSALGSTSAVQWNTGHAVSPPTHQYVWGAFLHQMMVAMQLPNALIGGIVINQGEADAQIDAPTATAWTSNWDTICTDILTFASAKGWSWKKAYRFWVDKLQAASTLGFKTEVRAAQQLLADTTRTDVRIVQEPDASPGPNIHLYAAQQIALGVLRANDWFAAT